ncbi:MAG: hypothetical protein IPI07_14270 [Flavobacteriales bacterium]|nr:hypothetical protein [Flavobacteriales bacterium]
MRPQGLTKGVRAHHVHIACTIAKAAGGACDQIATISSLLHAPRDIAAGATIRSSPGDLTFTARSEQYH